MDTPPTQHFSDGYPTKLYTEGSMEYKEDGLYFKSRTTQLCFLPRDINYAGLIQKLTPKVQRYCDEREIFCIWYRRPAMGDNNTVHFSSMELKDDDDVRLMLDTHHMYEDRVRGNIELYILTQRTWAQAERNLCLWAR